ncbi:aldose 1-epimerase [Chloroflexota bacterium]
MFRVETKTFGNLYKVNLVNISTAEYVSIIPGFGGNVNEIVLSKNGKTYNVLDSAKTYTELMSDKMFKGSKLLPFPNRIKYGRYNFEGRAYQLPVNFGRHAIHGFMYNKTLQVTKQRGNINQATLELSYQYGGTVPGYPFKFKASLIYSLIKDFGFQYTTVITNVGSSSMPVGDGWHPYFKTYGKVDNLHIRLPSNRSIKINNQMIPTGELVLEDYPASFMIDSRQFDTGFALHETEGKAITEIIDPNLDLKINIWQETGKMKYNFLQVFIPSSRVSIAIEPMTCAANAFNNNMGLAVLQPNQSLNTSCGVYVS